MYFAARVVAISKRHIYKQTLLSIYHYIFIIAIIARIILVTQANHIMHLLIEDQSNSLNSGTKGVIKNGEAFLADTQ